MKSVYVSTCMALTVCMAALGDVFLALAMRRIGDLGLLRQREGLAAVIRRVATSGAMGLGIVCMSVAYFSNLAGLSWAELSLFGPAAAALTFVANALAAKFFLQENVDRRRWIATLFVCAGVALLSRS